MGMKPCGRCRLEKPLEEFYRRKHTKDGRDWICKECGLSSAREWRKANPDKVKAAEMKWRENNPGKYRRALRQEGLKRSYGITNADFDRMIIAQTGRCELCGEPFDERSKSTGAHVDHDHRTGRIRSLLHNTCNLMLGCADDDIEILKAAVLYLQSWE